MSKQAERVCKKCFKPYDAHSLCPICTLKATDDAFDKGFETGKTEAKIEAEAKQAPMIGLLKDSEEHLRWAYRNQPIAEDVQATLDDIGAVLK